MKHEIMTAKEYLAQAYHIEQQINCKLAHVMALRDLAMRATPILTDAPRADSPDLQQIAGILARLVDLENEINEDIDALIDLKREQMRIVRAVDDHKQRMLLELRYLCYKTWAAIAAELELDGRYVYKLHGKALEAIECILPDAYRQRERGPQA